MMAVQHEIIATYQDFFGMGDQLAGRLAMITPLIQRQMPSGFVYAGDFQLDKANNQIHLWIIETNTPAGLFPVAAIIIVLAIVALIGVIISSWKWTEANILKGQQDANAATIQKQADLFIELRKAQQDILNNPNLTAEQKNAALAALLDTYTVKFEQLLANAATTPPPASTSGTNWGLLGLAVIAALALSKG